MSNHGMKSAAVQRGFTLLELLVASTIFILVLTMLVGVTGSVTNLSTMATARLVASRQGREIFDLIQRDLAPVAASSYARGSNVPLQFWVNPPAANLPDTYKNPTAFFWQSPMARNRSVGNMAVLGYFVQRLQGNQSQLRRVLIEPNETAIHQLYVTSGTWLSPTIISQFQGTDGGAASANADRGWVASGVLGLWVRCLDASGNVITNNGSNAAVGWAFDSRQGYRSGSGGSAVVRAGVNALPSYVDVGLVCIAAKDVDKLDSLPAVPAGSPATFDTDITDYLASVQSANPRLKSAVSLTRRIRLVAAQ